MTYTMLYNNPPIRPKNFLWSNNDVRMVIELISFTFYDGNGISNW